MNTESFTSKLEKEISGIDALKLARALPIPADAPQPQISAERFLWEKYVVRLGIGPSEYLVNPYSGEFKFSPNVSVIGFCPAARLRVRPLLKGYAVLLELDGEEFWTHLPEHYGK